MMKHIRIFVILSLLTGLILPGLIPHLALAEKLNSQSINDVIIQSDQLYRQGNIIRASEVLEQAIEGMTPEVDGILYLDGVIRLATAYHALGYHQKALPILLQAISVAENVKDSSRHALIAARIADIYLSLGKLEDGDPFLDVALEKANTPGTPPEVLASVLNDRGVFLTADGQFEEAFATFEESIKMTEPGSELKLRAMINMAWLGLVYRPIPETMKQIEETIGVILPFENTHQKATDLIALGNIGMNILRIPEKLPVQEEQALKKTIYKSLDNAIKISLELQDHRAASYAYGYMAELYEYSGFFSDALSLTRSALYYAHIGRTPESLYLWQRLLGKLHQSMGNTTEAKKSFQDAIDTLNPIRRELFQGFRLFKDSFNEQVKPVYLDLTGLFIHEAENAKDDVSRELALKAARDTMELLKTAELEDFFQDECSTLLQSKTTLLDSIPDHTAIIYPMVLPEKLVILITFPDGIRHITTDVKAETLLETVSAYRQKLQTRTNNRFKFESIQLYDWIIRPIQDMLTQKEITTLIFSPDGILRLIPLATLYDGSKFLVEKFAIGIIPAIALTDPHPFRGEKSDILIACLSEARHGFTQLPSVVEEVNEIKNIMKGNIILKNDVFTIDNLSAEFNKRSYTILHIATHGVFGETPEDSYLLTYESKMDMNQLERLISVSKFREQPVELLTLSACQTSLGNERAALGLAGTAVKAGVRSVIATLWFVDDEAASLAIRTFYKELAKPGITKAEALQNAQKSLISQKRYRHPMYWAPFLMIGNWM